MGGQYQRKKKNFFILKNLQGKFILGLFLAVVIGGFIFAVLLGLFSADTMTISYSNSDVKVGSTPTMLMGRAILANWIFIILSGTIFVLIGVYFSHRVAGPLYRFQKALTEMKTGNLANPIHLREKDEGKQLAKLFNEFNQNFSTRLNEMKAEVDQINQILEKVEPEYKTSPEDLLRLARQAHQHSEQLQKQLAYFTLSDERVDTE